MLRAYKKYMLLAYIFL